jgi:hypothetical protein
MSDCLRCASRDTIARTNSGCFDQESQRIHMTLDHNDVQSSIDCLMSSLAIVAWLSTQYAPAHHTAKAVTSATAGDLLT